MPPATVLAVPQLPSNETVGRPLTGASYNVSIGCLVYFSSGIWIGACGLNRGLLAREGSLARRWWLWCGGCLLAFGVATVIALAALTAHLGSRAWEIAGDSAFVLSCAAASFAFLALFVRFAARRNRGFDSFNESAYGIYLVHYAFVSWLQLAMLKAHLSALEKGSLVFVGASLLSWGTAALLRRMPLSSFSQRSA